MTKLRNIHKNISKMNTYIWHECINEKGETKKKKYSDRKIEIAFYLDDYIEKSFEIKVTINKCLTSSA